MKSPKKSFFNCEPTKFTVNPIHNNLVATLLTTCSDSSLKATLWFGEGPEFLTKFTLNTACDPFPYEHHFYIGKFP
jgi:hypothetical protein